MKVPTLHWAFSDITLGKVSQKEAGVPHNSFECADVWDPHKGLAGMGGDWATVFYFCTYQPGK